MRFPFLDALVKMTCFAFLIPSLQAELPSCETSSFKKYDLRYSTKWSLALSERTAKVTFPELRQTLYFAFGEPECQEAVRLRDLQQFALQSTHELYPFVLLDQTSLIGGISGKHYVSDKVLQNVLNELGHPLNLEVMISRNVRSVFISPFDLNSRAFSSAKIKSLPLLDTQEMSALGRAEWILYFGLLMDRFEEAQDFFSQVRKRFYLNQEVPKIAPVVLLGHFYHGQWFVPGRDHELVKLIRLAGGTYLFDDLNGRGPYSISFEEVLSRSGQVDIWLPQASWSSLSEGLLIEGRHQFLLRGPSRRTYLLRKSGVGIPFFESGPMRPDLVLEDLQAIISNEEPQHFFIKGER